MVRTALPSTLLLAIALAACGGGKKPVKFPQVSIPGPQAWDGTPPVAGSVTFVSTLPGDGSKFVAYEVDTGACTVRRTVVDELDKLKNLAVTTITNPFDNAGTIMIIRNPPPPPPNGQDLLADALRLMSPSGGVMNDPVCQPQKPQKPQ